MRNARQMQVRGRRRLSSPPGARGLRRSCFVLKGSQKERTPSIPVSRALSYLSYKHCFRITLPRGPTSEVMADGTKHVPGLDLRPTFDKHRVNIATYDQLLPGLQVNPKV